MTTGWETLPGSFPWPPPNLQVFSAFRVGQVDLRWDDPSAIAVGGGSIVPTKAAGTITITGVPATLQTATGTITIAAVPIATGSTFSIGGVVLTAVDAIPVAGDDTFDGRGIGGVSAVASSIAAAINTGTVSGWGVATATPSGDHVDIIAGPEGAAGNGVTLSTDTNLIILSGATLDGGTDADTLSIGLVTLVATADPRVTGTFKVGPSNFDTAASICDAINDPTNHLTGLVVAIVAADIVTVVAAQAGTDGNAISLSTTSYALALSGSYLSNGAGAYCPPINNTAWTIVGVNIYRSDNGQRGPYVRVNRVPIGSLAYRDAVDNTLIENEIVRWDGDWLSKGTDSNNADWIFRAKFTPVVKAYGQAVAANAPSDIILKINGIVVPAQAVFGPTGDVTLINQPTWDLAREAWVPPILPTAASEVTVTYRYNANLIPTDLDRTNQVFYRVTTVALDPTGTSPSGLVETPLGYCPPVGLAEVETIDWIWREAKRRNLFILEQGGERVKLFKRKVSGLPCPCYLDPQTREYNQQPSARCHTCFPPGSLVRTDSGYRPIEQVQVGERVLSSDGLYHRVTRTFVTPFDGMLSSISTTVSTRAITATPEHPFWVLRGSHAPKHGCGPKCHKYIARGDGLSRPNDVRKLPSGRWHARVQVGGTRGMGRVTLGTYNSESEANLAIDSYRLTTVDPGHVLRWEDAAKVHRDDWLVAGWPVEVHDSEQVEIPMCFRKGARPGMPRIGATVFTLDEDFLWVVGLYLAEGSTGKRGITFSLHANEVEFQDRIVRFFLRYGYRPKVRIDGNSARVDVSSTTLASWFSSWVGRHCYEKTVPEELMRLPGDKGMHLVRGLHAGDGSKRDREITQTSEVLALQVAELLHRAGEQPLIRQQRPTRRTPNGNERRVAYTVSWAEATAPHVNRKGRWSFGDRVLAQVRGVAESAYTGPVYNLEVEGDHTYIVNGVIVHNCFGTGFVGGYDGPTDIIVAPDDAERRVSQTPNGRRLEHGYEVWTTENPAITQRDFIVKQTGERYSIGPVRRPAVRGLPLQQHFNIQYFDEQDIRYRIPVTGTDDLPWPETRYTNPEKSPCEEADPYPTGFEYQATPMGTEVPKIPDGREIRGRTPVWANLTYGGKGGGA